MSTSSSPPPNAAAERYRSWGEAQIGRMLARHDVPFLYEHPLAVVDGGRTRIWYPDFQLPHYGIILEYLGRLHDPAYAERVAHKRAVYEDNGVAALMFEPDVFQSNWPERILDRIDALLNERVASFRATRSTRTSNRLITR